MKGVETQTVYDRPEPAIGVLTDALGISQRRARVALKKLVSAGYYVAPREPTNSMLVAYLESYGQIAKTPTTMMAAIGKARRRWAAMGSAGTAVALSVKLIEAASTHPAPYGDRP